MSDRTNEAIKTHRVFKTLTFDLKSSAFTSPVEQTLNSPTTPTYNLPTIAGGKSLPRALQPKSSHQGVSVGYKPIFTGYGAVSKNSEDSQIPSRTSMACTFKSQCSFDRPSTAKESRSPTKRRNSIQAVEPMKSKVFSSKTIHVLKRGGVDNGSIFLCLGDALKKRTPEEEGEKFDDDVMRKGGMRSKLSPGGITDSLLDNSTISRAYISLQKSGSERKNNSSIDSTSLDLSWSCTSHGKEQDVDGVFARSPGTLPGTIRIVVNPEDGRNSKLNKGDNPNVNRETEPSPSELVIVKRHQVSVVKHSTVNHKIFQPSINCECDEIKDEVSELSSKVVVTPYDKKVEVPQDINKETIRQTLQTSANQDLNKQDHGTINQSNDNVIIDDDDDVTVGITDDESDDDDVERIGVNVQVGKQDVAEQSGLYLDESIIDDGDAELGDDDDEDDDDDDDDDDVNVNKLIKIDFEKEVVDDVVENKIKSNDKDDAISIDDRINAIYDIRTTVHDNDVPSLPLSIPPSFQQNEETTEAERNTPIEHFEPVDHSTVKSTHLVVEEVIEFGKLHLSGSDDDDDYDDDDTGCEESLANENVLFIDEAIVQQDNKTSDGNEPSIYSHVVETYEEDQSNSKTEKGLKALRKKYQEARDEDSKVRGDTTFVKFQKGYLGVGFCIEGGKGSPIGDRSIFVKRVVRSDVPLTPGDELLSINGEQLSSLTCGQAWIFLKSLPDGEMVLELRKKL